MREWIEKNRRVRERKREWIDKVKRRIGKG